MTLVLAATGREAIWMLTDRRLSRKGLAPIDDGRKVVHLDTKDGRALLGYAGLGATSRGTEPADWMSNVLHGKNLPLEGALSTLATACKRELPKHLSRISEPASRVHHIVIPAFVEDEARVYSIDLAWQADAESFAFRWTRHVRGGSIRPPRLVVAGSGLQILMLSTSWQRTLLRQIAAHDEGRVSARSVADELAKLNSRVHAELADKTVGPNCIVSWKYRKPGKYDGGGGHEAYEGTAPVGTPLLPTIANGFDLRQLVQALAPGTQELIDALREKRKPHPIDQDEVNARLAKLPRKSDENLR